MLKIFKNKSFLPKLNFSNKFPTKFSLPSYHFSPIPKSFSSFTPIKNKDIKSRHFSTSIKIHNPTPPLTLLSDFIKEFKSQDGNLGKDFYFQDLDHTVSLIIQTIQDNPNNIKNPLVIESIFLSLYVQYLNIAKATNPSSDAYFKALLEHLETPLMSLIRTSINNDPSLKDTFLPVFHDTGAKLLAEIVVSKTLKAHPYLNESLPNPQNRSLFINPIYKLLKEILPLPKIHKGSPSSIVLQTFGLYVDYATDFSTQKADKLSAPIFFVALPDLKK